jgi:hypothetical protein
LHGHISYFCGWHRSSPYWCCHGGNDRRVLKWQFFFALQDDLIEHQPKTGLRMPLGGSNYLSDMTPCLRVVGYNNLTLEKQILKQDTLDLIAHLQSSSIQRFGEFCNDNGSSSRLERSRRI